MDNVVVGGGLAGLLCAYRLARKGQSVTIVEHSPVLGGLLRSVTHRGHDGRSHQFDLGTHYLLLTGTPEIDEELLSFIDPEDWNWFDGSLPEGHYFAGKLDKTTGCLNACQLDEDTLAEVFAGFFAAPGDGAHAGSLAAAIEADFGQPALNELYLPILAKFAGEEPEGLAPEAWSTFAPTRLKLFEDQRASWLKRLPTFDRRLAYARREEGQSEIRKGYPKQGGIGVWVDGLTRALREIGVEVLTETNIISVDKNGAKVVSINVERDGNKRQITPGRLVFTIPPAVACRILGIESISRPPRTRNLMVHHFLLTRRSRITDLHWITVYDPQLRSFRVTLYDNIGDPTGSAVGKIGVETLYSPDGENHNPIDTTGGPDLIDELRAMGAIDANTDIESSWVDMVPRALPLQAPGWRDAVATQVQCIRDAIENVELVGAASGTAFGQIAIIRDVYEKL